MTGHVIPIAQYLSVSDLRKIRQLYRDAYGTRDRTFSAIDNAMVLECTDGSCGNAADRCASQEVAELIAFLLNMAEALSHKS